MIAALVRVRAPLGTGRKVLLVRTEEGIGIRVLRLEHIPYRDKAQSTSRLIDIQSPRFENFSVELPGDNRLHVSVRFSARRDSLDRKSVV